MRGIVGWGLAQEAGSLLVMGVLWFCLWTALGLVVERKGGSK